MNDLKVLIQREKIAGASGTVGRRHYPRFCRPVGYFCGRVERRWAIFLADLARQVKLDSTFDFIGVSVTGIVQAVRRTGRADGIRLEVRLTKDVDQSMRDKNVIP